MTGYQPTVTLQKNGCFYSRTIQHELMHVIGKRFERRSIAPSPLLQASTTSKVDRTVTTIFRSIWQMFHRTWSVIFSYQCKFLSFSLSLQQHNFNKYAWGSTVTNQGSNYDYNSIMHYETTAFSMNGKPTMVPRQSGVTIGKATVLSATDIAEVRNYYSCKA